MVLELWQSLSITLMQSFLSALLSLVIGFIGALGAASICRKKPLRWVIFLALLPNWVPVLFVILSVLLFVEMTLGVYFGLTLVVFTHVFINSGVVSVSLLTSLHRQLSGVLDLCLVEGASRSQTLKAIVGLLKPEFRALFFVVFSTCMASFAVPLVLGAGKVKTFEVLIYEQVRIFGRFDFAILLSVIQLGLLFVVSLFFRTNIPFRQMYSKSSQVVAWKPGLIPLLLPSVILVSGLTLPLFQSNWLSDFEILQGDILRVLPNTLMLSAFTSLLVFLIMQLIVFLYSNQTLQKLLFSLTLSSYTLLGFALFLIPPRDPLTSLLKIGIGLSIIFVPILYKLFLATDMARLSVDVETCTLLGASRFQTFRYVLWPQLQGRVVQSAFLAGFWALGDFALSTMVATDTITLPLLIRDLLISYRIDLATVLSFGLVFLSLIVYLIVKGSKNVFGHKLDQTV